MQVSFFILFYFRHCSDAESDKLREMKHVGKEGKET